MLVVTARPSSVGKNNFVTIQFALRKHIKNLRRLSVQIKHIVAWTNITYGFKPFWSWNACGIWLSFSRTERTCDHLNWDRFVHKQVHREFLLRVFGPDLPHLRTFHGLSQHVFIAAVLPFVAIHGIALGVGDQQVLVFNQVEPVLRFILVERRQKKVVIPDDFIAGIIRILLNHFILPS